MIVLMRRSMERIFLLAICILFTAAAGRAQPSLSLGKRIEGLPKNYMNPTPSTNPNVSEGKNRKLPWIVFSDRSENLTYTTPGGSLIMKEIGFMQPFFVSDERNGYLKLVKYEPGIASGSKLKSKKSAESFGWIPRSKMLLWQKSFTDEETGYPLKAITIIKSKNPVLNPGLYYDGTDSAKVYHSPSLENLKTKICLHEIIYVYKWSEDKKSVLVGSSSQVVTDEAGRNIYGWVPADAVSNWGHRLYINPVRQETYDQDDSIEAVVNRSLKTTLFSLDPVLPLNQPVLRGLPVLSYNQDGEDFVPTQVGIPADLFNRSQNSVISIKGSRISFEDYLKIRHNASKVNIIYVVDGGSSARSYFSGLASTVQSFENLFDKYSDNKQFRYGAVVYRSPSGCPGGVRSLVRQELGPDHRDVVRFLSDQFEITSKCTEGAVAQPMFEGVNSALRMLRGHEYETSLLILLGSTGETSDGEIYTTSQAMREADARLLAIQVYNGYDRLYNNFVIQARNLVTTSARALAEVQKERMAGGAGISRRQSFDIESDSISYYLDYPENSLIQGGVVFTGRDEVIPNQRIRTAVERMIKETNAGAADQIRNLDRAFRLAGREGSNINPEVRKALDPPLPDDFGEDLPHNAFKFYSTGRFQTDPVKKHPDLLEYSLVLNEMEFRQFNDLLSRLAGENLQADDSNFRSRLYKSYVSLAREDVLNPLPGSTIKKLTLSQYLTHVTGLPVYLDPLENYQVADLRSEKKMPQEDFEAFFQHVTRVNQTIKRQAQNQQRFRSNGRTYYCITSTNWKMQ